MGRCELNPTDRSADLRSPQAASATLGRLIGKAPRGQVASRVSDSGHMGSSAYVKQRTIIVGRRPTVAMPAPETPTLTRSMSGALTDIRQGWARRDVWRALALNDITTRYRRTILGPFWLTLQMAMWIVGIGLLYSQLFKLDTVTFLPFVATGLLMWSFLSGVTAEGGSAFINSQGYVKSTSLPLSTYAYQVTLRQMILFLHSAVVILILLVALRTVPSWQALYTVPLSCGLAVVNGFFVCLWLGPATTRFRDLQPFTAAAINLLMFLSPVFWSPGQLDRPVWALAWNPFAWFLQAFREGLVAGPIGLSWWVFIGVFTIGNVIVALVVFGRSRHRIAYWV